MRESTCPAEEAGVPRFTDRRRNRAQRLAVQRVISTATAATSVIRVGDGSIFVDEDHADWSPPAIVRTRITASGRIEAPDRLYRFNPP
jgi:hypothetical protein